MKIAYIHIPEFPVQVEIQEDPSLKQTIVVIGGLPHEDGSVDACSPSARMAGIRPGMSLRHAEQLAPRATFLPLAREKYEQVQKELLEILSMFSPFRESNALGRVYIDASGLERLYGSDEEIGDRILLAIKTELKLLPQIGLASNKFIAETAARLCDPGSRQVVSPGGEAEFLAPLPLIMLPSSDDTYRLLNRLGLETIGQVAELPVGALSRALGTEGLKLHRLANGKDLRPLMPQFDSAPLSVETNIDFPLESLEQVTAYSDRLTSQLAIELQAGSLVAGAIIVEVEQEYGDALSAGGYLQPPSGNNQRLSDRASGLLSTLDYASGVVALKVGLFPLQPFHIESKQLGIFRPKSFTYHNPLKRVVGSINQRFGEAAIMQATSVQSPPPEPVLVKTNQEGIPTSFMRGDSWIRIASIELHWRLEGDWWWGEGRKDYYKVVTRNGQIHVLYRDSQGDRWYLHSSAQPNSWPLS